MFLGISHLCEKYLKVSKRHQLPQLTPFDVEEQELYSELPLDDEAPHPFGEAESSHLTKETNSSLVFVITYAMMVGV